MNAIDNAFQTLKECRKKAFIPFLTAGDPGLDGTLKLITKLAAAGATLVEIGFPYSDPIADGPVIQASYTRALSKRLQVDQIFEAVKGQRPCPVPLAAMVSFSLVFRKGPEQFVRQALESGFSGAIIPDLPSDESEVMRGICERHDFKLIQLVTPTTPRDRAAMIARQSTGFLYYVSVTGITGERTELPADLIEQLTWLRKEASVPVCVGFGISKPEQVSLIRSACDGVIVGSALVRYLEKADRLPFDAVAEELVSHARQLIQALHAA